MRRHRLENSSMKIHAKASSLLLGLVVAGGIVAIEASPPSVHAASGVHAMRFNPQP